MPVPTLAAVAVVAPAPAPAPAPVAVPVAAPAVVSPGTVTAAPVAVVAVASPAQTALPESVCMTVAPPDAAVCSAPGSVPAAQQAEPPGNPPDAHVSPIAPPACVATAASVDGACGVREDNIDGSVPCAVATPATAQHDAANGTVQPSYNTAVVDDDGEDDDDDEDDDGDGDDNDVDENGNGCADGGDADFVDATVDGDTRDGVPEPPGVLGAVDGDVAADGDGDGGDGGDGDGDGDGDMDQGDADVGDVGDGDTGDLDYEVIGRGFSIIYIYQVECFFFVLTTKTNQRTSKRRREAGHYASEFALNQ